MKKALAVLLCAGLFTAACPFQLGLDFSIGTKSQISANMRFNHLFELKPQVGFGIRKNMNSLNPGIDANFYLPDISGLQHYVGAGLDVYTAEGTQGTFEIGGHYGLRYNVNEIISIFGEIGIAVDNDPFVMSSFTEGIGCTIYFPGSK
jgi:hypothetical protein